MRVATNVAALTAHRALLRTDQSVTASLRRLASGYRITSAADDAAGLGISEGLRSQFRGMAQAVRNLQDGIGLLRTADGALDGTHAVLQRMRELTVQAGNGGALTPRATAAVRTEFEQLRRELDRIAGTTAFRGIPLLDGSFDRLFQSGADGGDTVRVTIGLSGRGVDSAGLGLAEVGLTEGLAFPHTVAPAVAVEPSIPAPGRLTLDGDYVSASAATGFADLAGTIEYDGRSFDLASVDYTGAATAQQHLDRLNLAAGTALGTGSASFVATASGLVFTGETPGPDSVADDAAVLTPRYTGDDATLGPHTIDPAVPAAQHVAAPGRLTLDGDYVSAAEFPTGFAALAGTVEYDGRSFDLASVDYTGAGTAQEHLDRLNLAAAAALGTGSAPFVATASGLVFTGESPGPDSVAADAAALTPRYTGDAGTGGTLRAIDRAIGRISSLRADLGALDNGFSRRIDGLTVTIENTMAAESRIRDADMAAETVALSRNRILAQAGTAMLAQAHQSANAVLDLLR